MKIDHYLNKAIRNIQSIEDVVMFDVAYDAIQELFENLESEISDLEYSLDDKSDEIEQLRDDNKYLKDENFQLQLRLNQYE